MANGKENLKIKTVSGTQGEEELTFSPEEMHRFLDIVRQYIPQAQLRGID